MFDNPLMFDITLCVNEICSIRDKCLRGSSKPGEYSSHSMWASPRVADFDTGEVDCSGWLPIPEGDEENE